MIARLWRGVTEAAKAEAYARYLEETGLREYRATPGNRGVLVLRRQEAGRAEFLLLSFWDSWEAIRSFAGPDVGRAVYYPRDSEFLLERGKRVLHHEVLDTPFERKDAGPVTP